MSNCEYVRDYYKVPACIGRVIEYKGRKGIISKDGGNYIAVNFDDDKPVSTINIHPTDPGLKYIGIGKIREMTRSQQRYQDYVDADTGLSFAEYMGFLSKAARQRKNDDINNHRFRHDSFYRCMY